MMATLPGLPMFGHGQIEGFTEKYGMEYYRPRYDENADHWLVERHEREIAPLLHRRWLFAESNEFLLYDFFQGGGAVDENVFAYSNHVGGERALVVYNNRYGATRGTIDYSAAYADKSAGGLRRRRLFEGLGLSGEEDLTVAWRDSHSGLEYLRRSSDLAQRGLTLDLRAYQSLVFLDWRELRSTAEYPWDRLCDQLRGEGVPSLDDALVNLALRPVHDALRYQFDPGLLRQLIELAAAGIGKDRARNKGKDQLPLVEGVFMEAWFHQESFLNLAQAAWLLRIPPEQREKVHPIPPRQLGPGFPARMRAALAIPAAEALFPAPWTAAARRVLPSASPQINSSALWGPILGWCALQLLAETLDAEHPECLALDAFDRLRLREPFAQSFMAMGLEGEAAWHAAARIKVLLLVTAGIGRPEEPRIETEPLDEAAISTVSAVPADSAVPAESAKALAVELPVVDEEAGAAREPAAELEGDSAPVDSLPTSGAPTIAESAPFAAVLWQDPDLRWLTGLHEDKGRDYLVREPYEELLWWLLLPSLLRLPAQREAAKAEAALLREGIEVALEAAEANGYRLDAPGEKESPVVGVESISPVVTE
jgi:hypothetical protein